MMPHAVSWSHGFRRVKGLHMASVNHTPLSFVFSKRVTCLVRLAFYSIL